MKCDNKAHRTTIKLRQSSAFTLIEVLLAVAIIAILIAVAIPADTDSLERGRVTADAANERAAQAAAIVEYMKTGNFGGVPVSDTAIGYYDEAAEKWSDSYVGIASYGECTKLLKHKDNFLRGTMTVVDGVPYLTLSWTNPVIESKGGDGANFDLCSGDKSPEPPTPESSNTPSSETETESESSTPIEIASTPTARGWLWGTIPADMGIAKPIDPTNKCSSPPLGLPAAMQNARYTFKFECWEANGYKNQIMEFIAKVNLSSGIVATLPEKADVIPLVGNLRNVPTPETGFFPIAGGYNCMSVREMKETANKVRFVYNHDGRNTVNILCLHYNTQATEYTINTDKLVLRYNPKQTGKVEGGPRLEGPFERTDYGYEYYESVNDGGASAYPAGIVNVKWDANSETSGKISWTIDPIATGSATVECVYTFDLPFKNAPKTLDGEPDLVPFTVTIKTEVEVLP